MDLEQIGRRIYRDLSGEDGTKSREEEFATRFRGGVRAYGQGMVFSFFVLLVARITRINLAIGILGTAFVILGTVLFGFGTLTILPEFNNLEDIERQIAAYFGASLVISGSTFLIAPDLIETGFENPSTSILLYFLSLAFVFLVAFIATAFIFYLFFDLLKVEDQNHPDQSLITDFE